MYIHKSKLYVRAFCSVEPKPNITLSVLFCTFQFSWHTDANHIFSQVNLLLKIKKKSLWFCPFILIKLINSISGLILFDLSFCKTDVLLYFQILTSPILQVYKIAYFWLPLLLKMLLSKYSWMFIKDCVSRALPLFFSFSISCCFISYSDCVLIGTLGKGLKIIIFGGLIIQPGSGMQPYVPEFFICSEIIALTLNMTSIQPSGFTAFRSWLQAKPLVDSGRWIPVCNRSGDSPKTVTCTCHSLQPFYRKSPLLVWNDNCTWRHIENFDKR